MALLSPSQIAQYAYAAGFRGDALVEAIQLALQESAGYTDARHADADGSTDRGLLQFNDRAWPSVTTACADDPACAMATAYGITGGGRDWSPWSADFDGRLDKYLGEAQQAAAQMAGGTPATPVGASPSAIAMVPTPVWVGVGLALLLLVAD